MKIAKRKNKIEDRMLKQYFRELLLLEDIDINKYVSARLIFAIIPRYIKSKKKIVWLKWIRKHVDSRAEYYLGLLPEVTYLELDDPIPD